MDKATPADSMTNTAQHLVGRDGLIRNMLWRLGRGESLALYSGPRLGKTSLLLELHKQLWNDGVSAAYVDCVLATDQEKLRMDASHQHDTILLIDNCDLFVNDPARIHDLFPRAARTGTVFAGGRSWYEFFCQHDWGKALRRIPLAVLLDKDAWVLLNGLGWPDDDESIVTHGGTHPHILHLICQQAAFLDSDLKGTNILLQLRVALDPFFVTCMQELNAPLEHKLLRFLVDQAVPVNPHVAARALNQTTIKPVADILCWLGLISRCIRNDEATLFANCGLFNAWYRDHVGRR